MELEYYKLFNSDISNLCDSELSIHFDNIGNDENRIYNYNSFLNKYPGFDIYFYITFNSNLKLYSIPNICFNFHITENKENTIYNYNSFLNKYPEFDLDYYKLFNHDLTDFSNIDLCLHFHTNGINEKRIFSINSFYNIYTEFDIEAYVKYNSDMHNKSIKDIIYHYINIGRFENRIHNYLYFILPNFPDFDINYYSEFNEDLKHLKKIEYYKHFYYHGRNEDRIYSQESFKNIYSHSYFDIELYKAFNIDLNHLNELELKNHFYEYGKYEDRVYNNDLFIKKYPEFNLELYKKFNKELIFNTDQEYLIHFNTVGNKKNKEYFNYDFDLDNLNMINEDTKNKIYNHIILKNIKNYYELYEYNIQYKKEFFIYNKESFYKYYNDFDLDFYKNTYFNGSVDNDIDIMVYYHLEGKYQKHLINNRKKIIIYTPAFNIKCGGVVVMHYLAKIINEYDPSRFYCKLFIYNNLRYNNIFCNDFERIDEINDNTIIIYPEIISGNPLYCKNVVRWILLALGIEMPIDHYKNWDSTDLIYHWEPKSSDLNKMTCHYLNPIFNRINYNSERYKTCYLVKKGELIHSNIEYFHPNDSINLENMHLKEMANIFNECKYFYTYDPKTMYIIYALICGCIPIIYPLENISKEDYFKTTIFYKNNTIYTKGIAYGNTDKEINYALNTMNEGISELNIIFENEKNTVHKFLNDCEKLFF